MKTAMDLKITREMVLRFTADWIMVAVTLFLGIFARFLGLIFFGHPEASNRVLLSEFLDAYWVNLVILLPVCAVVFSLSGFYTRGRSYQSRYKIAVVSQAVSVSYLVLGFGSYFLGTRFTQMPRGAIVLAWLMTLTVLVGARIWAWVWVQQVRTEEPVAGRSENRQPGRVLVIGGAGFIGSALLPKLLARNHSVRVLDLFLYGKEPIAQWVNHPKVELIEGDFRQVDKVVAAMRDVDSVIHLGGIVGDPACALDQELTIDVNLMATRMVAEVAKGAGVTRFVFASTCSVYGASDIILDERSALAPISLYAKSKLASEAVLTDMIDDDFHPTILRFGTIYGFSGRTRFDLVVNLLTAKAMVDGKITVSGGDQWRPFLHVDDAALAVVTALEAPVALVRNETFNVGSDEQNYTIGQVAEIVNRIVPESRIVDIGADVDRRNYQVNFSKIRHRLGFQPKWTLESGILQVVKALKEGQIEDYREAKHSNVKFLTEEGAVRLPRRQDSPLELINASPRKVG